MIEFRKIKTLPILIVQFAVSGIAISFLSWIGTSTIKKLYYLHHPVIVHPWASAYFHPLDGALFNYLFLCLIFGILGLVFYNNRIMDRIYKNAEELSLFLRFSILFLSITSLVFSNSLPLPHKSLALLIAALSPLIYLISLPNRRTASQRGLGFTVPARSTVNWISSIFTIIVFFILSWQVIQVAKGPVFLMNEYASLFNTTIINGKAINNRDFLEKLKNDYARVAMGFLELLQNKFEKNKDFIITAPSTNESMVEFILSRLGIENLNLSKAETGILKASCSMSASPVDLLTIIENLNGLDMGLIEKFQNANLLEYNHQNMSRGQINHIGYILNPLNEYELGKHPQQIYWQYGWGNTLLMKGVMSLFGGISLTYYYKCYFFYILYFSIFLIVIYILFRDPVSIAGIFAFYSISFFIISFFYMGYTGFILAPGLIPSIHLFDALVLIPLLYFFRSPKVIPLFFVFVLVVLSLVINSQFGLMLTVAVYLAILLYIFENSNKRAWQCSLLTLSAIAGLAVTGAIIPRGPTGITHYYLMGFFSWKPKSIIVAFTISYLTISYLFLIGIRKQRIPLKYIYVFVFFYTQGLFIYFYWSGLLNHFPIVIPWMGIQLFLMFHIAKFIQSNKTAWWSQFIELVRYGTVFLAMLLVLICAAKFSIEKATFKRNFVQHQTYHWQFAKADLISTINPVPLQEAISQLQKYSGNNPGIFILSQYDNILPFLAGKYSAMPHFELPYYLVSMKEEKHIVKLIRKEKPRYIFVDSGISYPFKFESFDLWTRLFDDRFSLLERQARFGRMQVLQNVFNAISGDYVKIDERQLISVYMKRNYSE